MANKDIKNLVKRITKEGWSVELTSGHYKARHPKTKKLVSFSSTPSCPYAIKHILGDMKRAGRRTNETTKPT